MPALVAARPIDWEISIATEMFIHFGKVRDDVALPRSVIC